MSSTSPTRPTGSASESESYIAERSSSLMSRHRLLRTTPDATALTRIGASSTANARVSASSAPQMLAATVQLASGRASAMPVLRTMDPPGRRCAAACLTAAYAPQTRTSSARWQPRCPCPRSGRSAALARRKRQVVEAPHPSEQSRNSSSRRTSTCSPRRWPAASSSAASMRPGGSRPQSPPLPRRRRARRWPDRSPRCRP